MQQEKQKSYTTHWNGPWYCAYNEGASRYKKVVIQTEVEAISTLMVLTGSSLNAYNFPLKHKGVYLGEKKSKIGEIY